MSDPTTLTASTQHSFNTHPRNVAIFELCFGLFDWSVVVEIAYAERA